MSGSQTGHSNVFELLLSYPSILVRTTWCFSVKGVVHSLTEGVVYSDFESKIKPTIVNVSDTLLAERRLVLLLL